MKNSWKLFLSFLLVGVLSAAVGAGTYFYLNNKQIANGTGDQVFNQAGFRNVNYATPAENTDFTFAAEQTIHAVVHIKSVAKTSSRGQQYMDPWDFFFGITPQYRSQPRVGFGSGVIISNDGYIVTNNHVIEGADEIEVTMNDDKILKAKLIGNDAESDLALLKIEGTDFSFVPFGDSDRLKIGEWVLAVGNPFNLTSTVTAGIVSAKGRGNIFTGYGGRGSQAQNRIESYIQTDAAVNPGNSGGALVNTKGELVGINTAIYSETGNYIGYSFAIPMSIVKKVVSDIRQYGTIQRAMLGVTINELPYLKEREPDIYKKLQVSDGVYINGFSTNSSAKASGIQVGDVITAIDGVKIKNFSELRAQISRYNPGNKVKVQVQRGSGVKVYEVELKNDQGNTEIIKEMKPFDVLGASFKDISDDQKEKWGIDFGIEVTDIKNGKLKEIRIVKGSIILTANKIRVSSVDEFEKIVQSILKQSADDRGLFIRVLNPNGKIGYYAVDLND
ncbi:MAG: trypsin-like peptidase domain-containing protein [Dysgonamonadaceae bacterium]|jgi:Do/DeqQ family serine protease|nr:trypsin-like peptidase domain-containing protein [Dysgonamonadaceae bacterium]